MSFWYAIPPTQTTYTMPNPYVRTQRTSNCGWQSLGNVICHEWLKTTVKCYLPVIVPLVWHMRSNLSKNLAEKKIKVLFFTTDWFQVIQLSLQSDVRVVADSFFSNGKVIDNELKKLFFDYMLNQAQFLAQLCVPHHIPYCLVHVHLKSWLRQSGPLFDNQEFVLLPF